MAKYRLSNRTKIDLIDIWDYTVRTWSVNQAERYYNQIIETCVSLSKDPQLGKHYSEVNSDLLGFKAGRHIIFYQIIDTQEIFVFRILHEQMDLDSTLKG